MGSCLFSISRRDVCSWQSSSNHTRVKMKCNPMINPHHSSALTEGRAGPCGQELWLRPWRNTSNVSYCLLPMSWSVCLLIVPPSAKDGTTHSDLGLPIPISNQENVLQTSIQANAWGGDILWLLTSKSPGKRSQLLGDEWKPLGCVNGHGIDVGWKDRH